MKSLFSTVLLLSLLLVAPVSASPKNHTFPGNIDQVFDATVRAAQSNWSVKFVDRQTHTLSFSTGTSLTNWGMECSIALHPQEDGRIEVSLRTQKKGQLYAWSAGGRIADKLFRSIDRELSADPTKQEKSTKN